MARKDPEADIIVGAIEAVQEAGLDVDPPEDEWWIFDSSRVAEAAYDRKRERLYVRFVRPVPGRVEYVYDDVAPNEWRNLRRSQSPGRFVNRVLNQKPYHRIR